MESDRPELLEAPSGTSLRFAALIAVAISTTLFVAAQFGSTWPVSTFLDDASCQVRASLYPTVNASVDPDESKWALYRECMSGFFLPRLGWMVGGLLVLLAVAVAVYLVWPRWRIRRSRLERLDASPALWAKLEGPLTGLVSRAGLAEAPEFRLDPTSTRAGGVAFGTHRHPVVCLDAGLVGLVDRDREAFDAVVLHELAHVRNGDVATTYATLAVWRAVLAAVLVPYLVLLLDPLLDLEFGPVSLPATWRLVGVVLVLVLMVYLARTAVLRSREGYADALVAVWTGNPDPYRTLVEQPRRRIYRWTAIHPTRAARRAAMDDPKSLLRNGFLEALGSGVAVQFAWSHLVFGLAATSWYRSGNVSFLVMRVVWSVAVAAVVCVIAWRGAVYRRAGGTGRWTFAAPALGLGLGLALSADLGLARAAFPVVPGVPTVVGGLLFVVVAVMVCCWAGYIAELLGERLRGRAGLLSAGAVFVVCLSCLGWLTENSASDILWRDNLKPAVDLVNGYGRIVGVLVVPFLLNSDRILTAAALALLWVVPVLLGRGSVRVGALAGLVGGVLAVLIGIPFAAENATVRSAWELVALTIAQVVIAAVVARRVDRVTALIATWVVGVVGCLGIWVVHLSDWQVDSVLAARPLQLLPVVGTAAAVIGAVFAHGAFVAQRSPGHPLVAVVLVVSAAAVVWWPHAPRAAILVPDSPAVEAVYGDKATNIWSYGGGFDQIVAVTSANKEVFEALEARDPARVIEACDQVRVRAEEAAAFPMPPVDEVRVRWRDGLGLLVPAARECVASYRAGGGFESSLEGFVGGMAKVRQAFTLVTEAFERQLR